MHITKIDILVDKFTQKLEQPIESMNTFVLGCLQSPTFLYSELKLTSDFLCFCAAMVSIEELVCFLLWDFELLPKQVTPNSLNSYLRIISRICPSPKIYSGGGETPVLLGVFRANLIWSKPSPVKSSQVGWRHAD